MEALITKIPASVNDSELYKLGEFRLSLNFDSGVTGGNRAITMRFDKPATLELLGDVHFTDVTLSADYGKTMNCPANTSVTFYVTNGECVLKVMCNYSCVMFDGAGADNAGKIATRRFYDDKFKYHKPKSVNFSDFGLGPLKLKDCDLSDCTSFTIQYSSLELDIGELNLGTALTSLYLFSSPNIVSTLAGLGSFTSLANLNVQGSRCSGDISSLSECKGLLLLQIGNNSNITGNLEDFAEAMNVNRTSGTLSLRTTGSSITYQGNVVNSNKTITFTGSGYVIE